MVDQSYLSVSLTNDQALTFLPEASLAYQEPPTVDQLAPIISNVGQFRSFGVLISLTVGQCFVDQSTPHLILTLYDNIQGLLKNNSIQNKKLGLLSCLKPKCINKKLMCHPNTYFKINHSRFKFGQFFQYFFRNRKKMFQFFSNFIMTG